MMLTQFGLPIWTIYCMVAFAQSGVPSNVGSSPTPAAAPMAPATTDTVASG